MLRGKDKVEIEAGLLAIAHNITKMAVQRSPGFDVLTLKEIY